MATSPSENGLQLLSDALYSPVTVCSALSALKTIGTPEALDITQKFGLESGFTAQETEQVMKSLSDRQMKSYWFKTNLPHPDATIRAKN